MGRYGDKCQFTHDVAELRSHSPSTSRTLHTNSFCRYITRCHFIHNPEEQGPLPRLHQSTRLGSTSSGPALDWVALRAAFIPDLELELAWTLGLGLGKGGGGGCCCRQHHHHQQHQWAPGLPMAGRSPSASSLSNQGSELPIFEQGQWLPIFSRISVSD